MIRRGFTIVELVVAMALTSLLGLMTYALFGFSADNLVEVDSLETTSAKGRFAIEKMRTLFQVAGSFSSPDSFNDPFVQPSALPPALRVAGFQSYVGWQGIAGSPALNGDATAGRPETSFDGVILTGAFDFPTSFETGGFTAGSTSMTIPGNFLGMEKLNRVDPFSDVLPRDVNDAYFPDLSKEDWGDIASYKFLEADLPSRLVRVTDGLGYVQFFQPDLTGTFTFVAGDVVNMNVGSVAPLWGIQIPLVQAGPFQPVFKGENTNVVGDLDMAEIGLDIAGSGEGDRTYEASFIDSYWLHVVSAEDPLDPTNNLLILERLCAGSVALDNPTTGPVNPATLANCGPASRKLVADRVVDFQVWFDCADAAGDVAGNPNWSQDWITPDGSDPGGMCMNQGANYAPGQARVAHARLTLRTDEERPALTNQQFIDGETLCTSSAVCPGVSLRSFDINEELEGAAPVITFQTDIALRNFIIKDL